MGRDWRIYCKAQNLGNYYTSPDNSWRDDVSSIWNHQTGGAVSYFYDWKGLGYVRVGSLSAGNYHLRRVLLCLCLLTMSVAGLTVVGATPASAGLTPDRT